MEALNGLLRYIADARGAEALGLVGMLAAVGLGVLGVLHWVGLL